MPRPGTIDILPETLEPTRTFSKRQIDEIAEYCREEIDDAESTRFGYEQEWRECLRMYNGIPEKPSRDTPIPNAPNIEIPLGAIASDAIYAQTIDTIFQISPVVTVRPVDSRNDTQGKALQRLVNWGVENEWGLRDAINHATLDSTQLGTGIYYIPYIEQFKKSLSLRTIQNSSPMIRAIPIEDLLVPGSSCASIHDPRWVGLNQRFIPSELAVRAKLQRWDIDGVQTTGDSSLIRERREGFHMDRESGEASRELVEVMQMYVNYDIDHDGIPEDLLITLDKSSYHIMHAVYNPFDRCRPFESFVYQPKPHFFYGMGVIAMVKELERAVSDVGNYWLLNMLLANARVWVLKEGSAQEGQDIWPSKQIMTSNPKDDIIPLQMADTYASAPLALNLLVQFAERRTGVSDIAQGRGAQSGSRTPGITALSALQNVNQRFAPAFDNVRIATADAVRQCLYRYQERLMMGDPEVERKFQRLLGPEDSAAVIEILRMADFDNAYEVELTASNASVNREADRQAAAQLFQFLTPYYGQLMQILQVALNPMVPPEMQKVALRIVDAAANIVDKTVRTFDIVRDPELFAIRSQDILADQGQSSEDAAMAQQLMGFMQQNPEATTPEGGAPPMPGF